MKALPSRILIYALLLFAAFVLVPECINLKGNDGDQLEFLFKKLLTQRFLLTRLELSRQSPRAGFKRLPAEIKTSAAQAQELAVQCAPDLEHDLGETDRQLVAYATAQVEAAAVYPTDRYYAIDRQLAEFVRKVQRRAQLTDALFLSRARTLSIESLILAVLLLAAIINYARYRSKIERQLQDYNQRLEKAVAETNLAMDRQKQAEKRKEEMVAIVSHELRTPLTNTKMKLELLTTGVYGALPEKILQYLEQSQQSLDHLIKLINDLLCLERLSKFDDASSKMELCSVDTIIADAMQAVEYLAGEKRIVLSAEPAGFELYGRVGELQQVLTNLLSNAIKFSPPATQVKVIARRGLLHDVLEVKDKGPGIPPQHVDNLFEKFTRFHQDAPGTGLGLSICKEIINHHKGEISVCNNADGGCTFKIQLPLPPAPYGAVAQKAPAGTAAELDAMIGG